MKLPIIGILSGVALATSSGVAQAAILFPSLPPGSEYRLVFATSGSRDAISTNIADYNTFVQNAAQSSSVLNTALTNAGFNPLSISWTAIASTSAVNARVNTATQATDTSRPIYRLDGAQVATSYADLWDGTIGVPISLDETGNTISSLVWSGTLATGLTGGGFLGTTNTQGATVGNSSFSNSQWIQSGRRPTSTTLSLYGISSVLTVPTPPPPTTTPEPSSLLGFITLGGLMLGGAVRKARK
jgi:hypothetical protein